LLIRSVSSATRQGAVFHEQQQTYLNLYSPVVTICTASGHYMYRQWSLYVSPV